ncbi:hypothetical protein [Ideonella sp. BN130291]|uniref:hypothetical protein n=1 Tax=Ideonella sp. BN130291 TaxID=3112940 RepID=UPI002E2622A0|nr:hypothetical protein [Ideonella sp. BN130291]
MAAAPQDSGAGAAPPTPAHPGDEAPAGAPGSGESVCRRCGGSGRDQGQACPDCGGTGKVIEGIGGG